MKRFRKFLLEVAAPADKIDHDANLALNKLNKELAKVLGDRYVIKSHYSTNLGKSIHLRIVDTQPYNKIDHNSPVFSQFMMYLSPSQRFGSQVKNDLDTVSWEMSQGPRSIPYRKISSSKSIDDATNKLIEWFKKNKSAYDSLLKKEVNEAKTYFELIGTPKNKEEEAQMIRIAQKAFGRARLESPLPNGLHTVLMRFDRKHHRDNAEYVLRNLKRKYIVKESVNIQENATLISKLNGLGGEILGSGFNQSTLKDITYIKDLYSFAKKNGFQPNDIVLEFDDLEGGYYNNCVVVIGKNQVIVSGIDNKIFPITNQSAIIKAAKEAGDLHG